MFQHLPRQRKLSLAEEKRAKDLLEIKVNKKMLQDTLVKETGKIITLKDLTNINSMMKQEKSRNNLDECIQKLTKSYGKFIHVYVECSIYQCSKSINGYSFFILMCIKFVLPV